MIPSHIDHHSNRLADRPLGVLGPLGRHQQQAGSQNQFKTVALQPGSFALPNQ